MNSRDGAGGRSLIVSTGGHVDHGKTVLVRALTGTDTDRWEEEKERGLTIDLGFARLDAGEGDVEVGIVDVPGHEDFVRNMLAGATGTDLLLLVVAADEGPMPQTREHLAIAHLLGVREGIVALSKVDVVEPEWRELATETVQDELRTVLGHADWPVIPVSAVTGEGMEELRAELARRSRRLDPRPVDDRFRLPVDRSFSLPGAGTVATGTVWSGRVEVEDRLDLHPLGREVRVRSVEVHGESREAARAGSRCGLALVGVDPGEIPRGSTLVSGAGWQAVGALSARLRLLRRTERTVEDGQRVRVFLGTQEAMARVRLAGEGPLAGGGQGWARLDLEEPVVARARDRFVLRFYSPVETIGGGRVAELGPPRSWEDRTDEWRRLIVGDPRTAVRAAAALAGGRGLRPPTLPVRTGHPAGTLRGAVSGPPEGVLEAGGRWFSERAASAAEGAAEQALERLQRENRRAAGVSLQAVRSALAGRYADPLVEQAVDRLIRRGKAEREGPRIRRPDHRPELTEEERERLAELRGAIDRGGIEPPTVDDLAAVVDGDRELLHDLLALLTRSGDAVAVSPEIYLSSRNEERVRATARRLLEGAEDPVPAGRFKEEYDVSRKYLIPYLEYLDRIGLTRRTGEGRVLVDPEVGPPAAGRFD